MHQALYYQRDDSNAVVCGLCAHRCRIKPGRRGLCGVRENHNGELFSLVYGRLVAENIDPVEKKPLFHFLPGSRTYSIATVGCNFHCRHCQNYEISQYPIRHKGEIPGTNRSPEEIVRAAMQAGCASMSYTYVEPTIFYEFARDCAQLARMHGVRNVFVSNGYMTPEVTRDLALVLDAINIDIKAFSDDFYRKVCHARLEPVLDTVRLMHELGVWVEVTTLLIPGLNDDDDQLKGIASFIGSISKDIPWHVTAFRPMYKMMEIGPTPMAALERAFRCGRETGLSFVYRGNMPGGGGEDTLCPRCGTLLVARKGFSLDQRSTLEGICPDCKEEISGVWR